MFCKACGKEVMDTAVICTGCGSSTTGSIPGAGMSEESISKLIMWGWLGACLLPIVGLVIGIVLCVKGKINHGIGQVVVSLFSWAFWAAFVTACFAGMAASA
jgi:hypothetical protein